MLQPTRTKFRKAHKGRIHGNASRCNKMNYGAYGLKAIQPERVISRQIESDEIDTKIKQSYVMGQRYKITGVPAIIVNGKYMISGSTAGSFENVTKIMDMLIEKERSNLNDN